MAVNMTLGQLSGYLQFAKAAAGSIVITDFSALFAQVRTMLQSFGQLTPEIAANLDLAQKEFEAALKANPNLFDIGKATFISGIDAIVAKYPASTLISDIPELSGGSTPGQPVNNPVVSTVPSAVVFGFLSGVAPSAEKLASLADFAKTQFEAYKAAGVARAEIGPYEAIGRGFAETVQFNTKYGLLNTAEFVSKAYGEVFERAATAAQNGHFQSQVSYFENLYKTAGVAAATAALLAKGAVIGQMLGFAVLDEAAQHPYIANATKGLGLSAQAASVAEAANIAPQSYDFV